MSEIQIKPFSYSVASTPEGYVCGKCKQSGIKLWRNYQTFLNNQSLHCASCACEEQKKIDDIDQKGRSIARQTDQIGSLVPAVPTEDGTTFWGYTSVPQEGCEWWYNLPTRPYPIETSHENLGSHHAGYQD